jgi:hypothetical protein
LTFGAEVAEGSTKTDVVGVGATDAEGSWRRLCPAPDAAEQPAAASPKRAEDAGLMVIRAVSSQQEPAGGVAEPKK